MRRLIDIVSPISTNRPSLLKKLESERLDEAKGFQTMMIATNKLVDEFARDYDRNGLNLLRTLQRYEQIASNLRQDRAVWFLREIRWIVLRELTQTIHQTHPQETEHWESYKQRAMKLFMRCEAEFKRQTGFTPTFYGNSAKTHIENIWHSLEHFKGVPYTKLQTYVFDMSKTWGARDNGIKAELSQIEDEFIEKARGKVTMKEGDQIILEMPDNYVWVKLSRAACDDEANAMGHCGNSPRSGTGDRIISLRHIEEVIEDIAYMRPCLTFILYSNGYLGEMKGRGNQKPAAHYHDQIETLLRSEHIKGIIGDGYAAENNFSINDMEHDRAEALLAHNPRLLPPKDLYKRYGLTGPVMELFDTVYWGQGYKKFLASVRNLEVTKEDQPVLFAKYQSPAQLYGYDGLTANFLKLCKAGINSMDGSRYRYDYDAKAYVHRFWNSQEEGTGGVAPAKMKPEERAKLFKYVPEGTLPKQFYETFGVNDDFAYTALVGVAGDGPYFLFKHGMDTEKWPEEDQSKLWTTDLHALAKKLDRDLGSVSSYAVTQSPDFLASFRWWYKHHNDRGTDLFDHKVTLAQKVNYAVETWGGSNGYIIPEQKAAHDGRWKFGWWTDLDAFLEDLQSSENSKHDFSDLFGDDDSIEGHMPDDNDHNVQNFDDSIGIQTYLAVRRYALEVLNDNDYDFEEDFEEYGNLDDWETIYKVFAEYESDICGVVKEAVQSGEEAGAGNARSEARQAFFTSLKPKWGTLRFTSTFTNKDGREIPHRDSQVFFDMDDQQLCEYFDKGFSNGDQLMPDEFFEPHFDAPRYGWQGYDEEAAGSYFVDNCPIDLPEEKNPFPNADALKGKSVDKMRMLTEKLITRIQKELPKFSWTVPTDDKQVADSLLRLCAKYYG